MGLTAQEHNSIELLRLRLMNGHHLYAVRIIHTIQNQILGQRRIQCLTRLGIRPVDLPTCDEVGTDALPPVKCHQIIQVLCHGD